MPRSDQSRHYLLRLPLPRLSALAIVLPSQGLSIRLILEGWFKLQYLRHLLLQQLALPALQSVEALEAPDPVVLVEDFLRHREILWLVEHLLRRPPLEVQVKVDRGHLIPTALLLQQMVLLLLIMDLLLHLVALHRLPMVHLLLPMELPLVELVVAEVLREVLLAPELLRVLPPTPEESLAIPPAPAAPVKLRCIFQLRSLLPPDLIPP